MKDKKKTKSKTKKKKPTTRFWLRPIGIIRSPLKDRHGAPRQGSEGAPDAWLDVRAWAAAGLISVAVILGYAFTRLVGTTFDNEDVGNWSCMLGLASLFVEAALLAPSGFAIALVRTDIKDSQPEIELERELILEGSSSVG